MAVHDLDPQLTALISSIHAHPTKAVLINTGGAAQVGWNLHAPSRLEPQCPMGYGLCSPQG